MVFTHSILKSSLLILFLAVSVVGCNANSTANQFKLAQKLLAEEKFEAAIHEFQKIVNQEPMTPLGISALHNIGNIQHIYLKRSDSALDSYKTLLKRAQDSELSQEVYETIGKIYFEEYGDYLQAAQTYGTLIEKFKDHKSRDFFTYRLGRSLFLSTRFKDAIKVFHLLKENFPDSPYSLKADLEIANALSASGECKDAIPKFQAVIEDSNSKIRNLAIFGLATCYEEVDDLDKAYDLLAKIRKTYPSPEVINLKMKKIKRRKILRRR